MLDKLSDTHRGLEESAARLRAVLAATALDAKALQEARWDIGTRIMQHLAQEDRYLYANLAKDDRPHVREKARAYQADFAQYMADYADHAKQWTAERVEADWDTYRAATQRQLDLLFLRMAKVEAELFPLARTSEISVPRTPSASWARQAFAIKDSITGRA